MRLISLEFASMRRERKLWPQSWISWAAIYVLALDLVLFAVQWLTRVTSPTVSASLGGWIIFLTLLAILFLAIAGFRWVRSQILWRLRNRLIVTYVFIGVIPVFLLVMISLIALYLFAGQFASFVVTSDVVTHLRSMEAANRAIAHHLATQLASGGKLDAEILSRVRSRRPEWSRRELCAWYRSQTQPYCTGPEGGAGFAFPSFITGDFSDIVSDGGKLYLRTATVLAADSASLSSSTPSLSSSSSSSLRVILSEPVDQEFVEKIAGGLGRITVYGTEGPAATATATNPIQPGALQPHLVFDDGGTREETFAAGTIPPATNALDREITLRIPLQLVDWATGKPQRVGALAEVETRASMLYARLFAARGDYAKGVEYILLLIAIVFALIEMLALFVGTKLTRSITSAVGQLYEATKHINRADFSHRITVQSSDQLATLANSFNSMTTSIEKLVQEQK
jgi:phosphoserine phosphatase RsbU/P